MGRANGVICCCASSATHFCAQAAWIGLCASLTISSFAPFLKVPQEMIVFSRLACKASNTSVDFFLIFAFGTRVVRVFLYGFLVFLHAPSKVVRLPL